jgi:alpha-1,6-mannosyltransferase
MVSLVILAFVFAIRQRWILASLLATLALGIKPVAIVVLPFIVFISAQNNWPSRIKQGIRTGLVSAVTLVSLSFIAGVGPLGWLSALGTPGTVKSWLSPFTAIGMGFGQFMVLLGFENRIDFYVTITRAIGSLVMAIIVMYLFLKPQGRSATRGAAFAFCALVAFGPVIQPWYLLWGIPLIAASGLSHKYVRAAVIVIAAFTIHGIANSSATTDTFLDLSDGLAILLAVLVLGIAALASPHERQLILGDKSESGIKPQNPEQFAASQRMIVR